MVMDTLIMVTDGVIIQAGVTQVGDILDVAIHITTTTLIATEEEDLQLITVLEVMPLEVHHMQEEIHHIQEEVLLTPEGITQAEIMREEAVPVQMAEATLISEEVLL